MTEENKLMVLLKSDNVKERFIQTVGPTGGAWITAVINAANLNPVIWECEPVSVITAGLNAAALRLSLDGSTGQACILPFNKRTKINGKWESVKKAQFVPMVRGLKQLAMRTDKYRWINSTPVYEGEIIREDRMSGIQYLEGRRTGNEVVGYYAAFQFYSGLTATEYMTVEECLEHGKKYSPTYNKREKKFYSGSKWVEDFPVMAEKTVLRKLLLNKGYIAPDDRAIIDSLDDDKPLISDDDLTIPENVEPENVEPEPFDEKQALRDLGVEVKDDQIVDGEFVDADGSESDSQVEDAGQPDPQSDGGPLWDPAKYKKDAGIYWDARDSNKKPYRDKDVAAISRSFTALDNKTKKFREPQNEAELKKQEDTLFKRDACQYWIKKKTEEQENG